MQLDVDDHDHDHDHDAIVDCLKAFVTDPQWLQSCVQSALKCGFFEKSKYVLDLDKIAHSQSKTIFENNVNTEDESFNFSLDEKIIDAEDLIQEKLIYMPYESELKIIEGELLPEWFIEFFKQANAHVRYSSEKYIIFKIYGDRGDIAPLNDPESILNMLIDKNLLKLSDQENSLIKKELLLVLIKFFNENGISKNLDRAEINRKVRNKYGLQSISTIASKVRKAMASLTNLDID